MWEKSWKNWSCKATIFRSQQHKPTKMFSYLNWSCQTCSSDTKAAKWQRQHLSSHTHLKLLLHSLVRIRGGGSGVLRMCVLCRQQDLLMILQARRRCSVSRLNSSSVVVASWRPSLDEPSRRRVLGASHALERLIKTWFEPVSAVIVF